MKMRVKQFFQSRRCRDLLCVLLLILTYTLIVLIKTENGRYLLASELDFSVQHYTFPEYLRTLFYDTGDLLPDFSFHLGAGQNIYCLSYYGLFSPFVLLSYLFPSVAMLDFIIVIMTLVVLSSVILFYFFLKKNGYSQTVSFLCSFMLLCASPFIFHSARHIMFVNYMPFLILGLYGIDRYVEKKKRCLLIVAVVLMIFTSYHFSIPGMIMLFVYGLFKYARKNGLHWRRLVVFGFKCAVPFCIAVLISAILILPALGVFFTGRAEGTSELSLLSLFIPNFKMLYKVYSMGLTAVCAVACLCMLFSKRKENRILSGFLLLICTLPIFTYVLNIFLYTSAKVLIPFIPLVLINTADFLTSLHQKWKESSIVQYKAVIRNGVCFLLILSSLTVCILANRKDKLITREDAAQDFTNQHASTLNALFENEPIYRVNTSLLGEIYVNRVANTDEYKTTLYSSIFQGNYRSVYRDLFENPLEHRNEFIISASSNLIFQMFMGEKYVYSKENLGFAYEAVSRYGDVTLYRNNYVLPIGYATDCVISTSDFEKLNYPNNMLSLLGNAVADGKITNTDPIKAETVNEPQFSLVTKENLHIEKTDTGYRIDADEDACLTIRLENESLTKRLLFLDFSLAPSESDLTVCINGITNMLTAKDWKYYNQNSRFAYVIENEDNLLHLTFTKGSYEVGDLSLSTLDFSEIQGIKDEVDALIIDKEKTKGDTLCGNIHVKNDGVMILTVPYDKGFTVYVDGKETDYYLANEAFIGFDITKGEHTVTLCYKAPLKTAGFAVSGIGIALFASTILYEKRKKEKSWN